MGYFRKAGNNENSTAESPNAFEQDAVVVTTYDFAAKNSSVASAMHWSLTVFKEANSLSGVYHEDNKQVVTSAEDILFITFTKELADKVKITPQYILDRSAEIESDLWTVVNRIKSGICTAALEPIEIVWLARS